MDNFGEIYTELRTEVGESDTEAVNTLMKKYVNRSYKEVLSTIAKLNRGYFSTTTTVDTVADQKEYNFNTDWSIVDLLKLEAIKDDNDIPLHRGSKRQELCDYYLIGNAGIGFVPTPASIETYTLHYIQRKDDMSDDADTPEFEKLYWDFFVFRGAEHHYRAEKNIDMANHYKAIADPVLANIIDWAGGVADEGDIVQIEEDGLS